MGISRRTGDQQKQEPAEGQVTYAKGNRRGAGDRESEWKDPDATGVELDFLSSKEILAELQRNFLPGPRSVCQTLLLHVYLGRSCGPVSREPHGCSISGWLWFVPPLPPSLCTEQTCAFPLPSRQLERAETRHATSLPLRLHRAGTAPF